MTTTTAVPTQLNESQIAALAYAVGFRGQGLANITAIALAESGGNTQAGASGYEAGTHNSVGLAQINLNAHPQYSLSAMLNPIENLKAAYQLSAGGTDFTPWTTFDTGAYRQYLPSATVAANMISSHQSDIAAGILSGYSPVFTKLGLGAAFGKWFSTWSDFNFSSVPNPLTAGVGSLADPVVSGIENIILNVIPWMRILEIVGGFALILVSLLGLVSSVSGGVLGDAAKVATVGVAA